MANGEPTGITTGPARPAGSPAPVPATNVRFLILGLACGISFLLYLHRYVWGFIKEDVRKEFGWDPLTLAWLDNLFLVTYAGGQVPSGMLGDWFGAHALLGSSILLWSLALAAVALASGVGSMAAARLGLGAAQAPCYPVLNKVSKNWFPIDVRTTAQALIATCFGRAGGAASFFLFGTVLVHGLGLPWRAAVGVFTLLGLLAGVLFLLLFRNRPGEHPWANAAEADLVTAGDPEAAHATRARLRWGALARSRTAWVLFLRAFSSNVADPLFVYWVPTYLLSHGLHAGTVGWLAALPLLGGAAGGVASGALQSALIVHTSGRRWARRTAGMGGKLTAAGLMLATLPLADPVAVGWLFMAVKFFGDMEQPAEWGTISDVGGRSAATLFGCVNTIGALGGIAGGAAIGSLLKHFRVGDQITPDGWKAVFALVALVYVVSASCWPFIDPERPLDPSPPKAP